MNPCIVPAQYEDQEGDYRNDIHKRFLQDCLGNDPDVLFIGDSILESLQFTEIWNQLFSPLHCLNFSLRNDLVQNVLWRLKNGELEHVKPKIVVLHVGTNNIKNSAEEISEGILEIVKLIRSTHPEAFIVLPTLLPRGHSPNKLRVKNDKINSILKEKCAGLYKLQVVEIDKGLVQAEGGLISHHDMFDYLNLTNAGSKKVFEPVWDLLNQILNENEHEKDLTPSE